MIPNGLWCTVVIRWEDGYVLTFKLLSRRSYCFCMKICCHGFHVCGLSYIAAKNTVDAKGWSKKGITHQTITFETDEDSMSR
ncbi:hypothetical protein YC2023_071343 [Brassica napus]